MPIYYINLHPFGDYFTIVVGKGGYISKEYTKENQWIYWARDREFHAKNGFLSRFLSYIREKDPNCIIKVRCSRNDEWQILHDDEYLDYRLEVKKKQPQPNISEE